jgi:hypothetical protein
MDQLTNCKKWGQKSVYELGGGFIKIKELKILQTIKNT